MLVATELKRTSILGIAYTPEAISRVSVGKIAPIDGYAPESWTRRTYRLVTCPSRSPPIVNRAAWARPWPIAVMCSERVSVQRTGRPGATAFMASQATITSSTPRPLPPNPPPTSGARTCTCPGSSPRLDAMRSRSW